MKRTLALIAMAGLLALSVAPAFGQGDTQFCPSLQGCGWSPAPGQVCVHEVFCNQADPCGVCVTVVGCSGGVSLWFTCYVF